MDGDKATPRESVNIAFEVALLDDATGLPLLGPSVGLTRTDAFLNIQPTGEVFFGPGVTVSAMLMSGGTTSLDTPLIVKLDLHGVPATPAVLSFDLLGFGPATSFVSIQLDTASSGGEGGGPGGDGGGSGGSSRGGGSSGDAGSGSTGTGGNLGGSIPITVLSPENGSDTSQATQGGGTDVDFLPEPRETKTAGWNRLKTGERATILPEESAVRRAGGYFDLDGGTDDDQFDEEQFWLWLEFGDPTAPRLADSGRSGSATGSVDQSLRDAGQPRWHTEVDNAMIATQPVGQESVANAVGAIGRPSREKALGAIFAEAASGTSLGQEDPLLEIGPDRSAPNASWAWADMRHSCIARKLPDMGLTKSDSRPGRGSLSMAGCGTVPPFRPSTANRMLVHRHPSIEG